eukprot:GILI01060477.1.p1 GENE.GILI01060477.1~~GILI01060477.1.p1  ORF type:complete len:129 (+),score=12.38 GILI01060477.1:3-389(+)
MRQSQKEDGEGILSLDQIQKGLVGGFRMVMFLKDLKSWGPPRWHDHLNKIFSPEKYEIWCGRSPEHAKTTVLVTRPEFIETIKALEGSGVFEQVDPQNLSATRYDLTLQFSLFPRVMAKAAPLGTAKN